MNEVWKDVVGYEGLYEVSDLGNARSLNWKNCGYAKNLYLKHHNKGYLQVELVKNKVKKTFVVHRLVAMAFIDNPYRYALINHKDENKTNNRVWNLEWCDYSYNNKYSRDLHPERFKQRKSTKKYGRRLDLKVEQYSKDGILVRLWDNSRTVFLETGMSDWSISECCRGKRHTAYGFIWKYSS